MSLIASLTMRILLFLNLLCAVAVLSVMPPVMTARAAWPHDPNFGNVALCTATGDQQNQEIASDGAGGAIVTWHDARSGNYDIYAQKVNAAGVPRWTPNGVALCTATGNQWSPTVIPDGAGGAIVTWYDDRSGDCDIYAQKVNAAGVPQWTANGVALCTATGDQQVPTIVSDGAGGAIVTWDDTRSNNDIYAQKVNAAGVPQWTPNGVALCTATGAQRYPNIVSDGVGGAVVTWYDTRSGSPDIYAQKVSEAGVPQWNLNGVALCTATGDQFSARIVSDGAGGAIVAWQDSRSGNNDIYAQKVNWAAVSQWTADGVALCTATGNQWSPTIALDGAGGAIVTWHDSRSGNHDIYAQKVNTAGVPQWTANGVALCTATGDQWSPTNVSDGAGGAIVAWYDVRSGDNDIYAQKVNAAGTTQWTANGVALCTALGYQYYPTIISDGAGGAIVTWQDTRSGNYDIYAQRVERFGYLGPEPTIVSVRDVPNDQGGKVKVAWYASWLDAAVDPNLSAYDVYRSAPGSLAHAAARQGARILESFAEVPLSGERAFVLDPASIQIPAWEYLATIPVTHFLDAYGYIAPTTGDSLGGSNPYTAFMVVGRNSSGNMFWLSAPDSGYSVDNLAPPAPTSFAGQYAGGTARLHWEASTAPDFATFRLYRGATPDFVPGPGNLVVAQPDTGYVDYVGALYYYKLAAVDLHGNAGPYAMTHPIVTDVSSGLLPRDLALGAPAPNPLRGGTTLRLALPREAQVSLSVYDQRGRRVRPLIAGALSAGERWVTWDGRDGAGRPVASGVYYVRLTQGANVRVQRVTVVR